MKHLYRVISVLLMFSFLLTACGTATQTPATQAPATQPPGTQAPAVTTAPAAQEPVTLLVWDAFGDNQPAADTVYANFMAAHPNITIQEEPVPLEQALVTVKTALSSGTGPDIIYHDVTPERDMFAQGLILDLTSYADQYKWKDSFYPSGLGFTTTNDGKIFGLGLEFEFVGVFYNKTLMDQEGFKVPSTISETLDFCKQAKAKGYIPFSFGQNPGWQAYFSFTMPVHNMVGIDYMTNLVKNGVGSWDTPDILKAVNVFYVDMKNAGCFSDDVNGLDWDGMQAMLWSGKALMIPTGSWLVPSIIANTQDGKYTFEMMPFPEIEGGKGGRVYTAGMGSAWAVSAATKHPAEAAMLLDYIFSPEAVKIWYEQAHFIPPVNVDASSFNLPPLTKFVAATLNKYALTPGGMGYNIDVLVPSEFDVMLSSGFQAVWAGTKTPEQQLADLEKIWEARAK